MKDKKNNIFKTYVKSIVDFNSYLTFFKESLGKAFLYLLFLTIFIGGLSVIKPIYAYNTELDSFIRDFKKNAPNFYFEENELFVDSDTPIVYEMEEGAYKFIIDTSGKTDSAILQKTNDILISKNNLYIKQALGNVQTLPYSDLGDVTLNKSSLITLLPKLKILSLFIALYTPVFFFIGYLFNALILSIVGVLLNNIMKLNLKFSSIYKLSIYALTLPCTFQLLVESFDKSSGSTLSSFIIPVYFIMACIYLTKAFKVIKLNHATLDKMI